MAKTITQEMFDATVKENMEEFEMDVQDAIQDTVKQFEAQGVELSHIIVDLMAHSKDHQELIDIINALKEKREANLHPGQSINDLVLIQKNCEKNLAARVIAGKEGLYSILLQLTEQVLGLKQRHPELLEHCLKTLIVLMTRQPDLLNEQGIRLMIRILDQETDQEMLVLILKWIKECCTLHEFNRQHIINAGILDHLKPLLTHANAKLLIAVLGVLRTFVLDDDVRVEFGKAHEHARMIASDTLCAITALLEKFKINDAVMNELMLTLSALLVRTEFCKKVEDAGGLTVIHDALLQFQDNEKITRQCFKVIKALAGNDECKAKIVKNGTGMLIIAGMKHHKESALTAISGLACIAALTLRSPENSNILFECGAAEVIVELMKLHSDNEQVQRNSGWAVRNMVSRSRHQNKAFLNLGIEALFKQAMKKFERCEYDIKAALRDLDCIVNLKEEWTGKGGLLNSDSQVMSKEK